MYNDERNVKITSGVLWKVQFSIDNMIEVCNLQMFAYDIARNVNILSSKWICSYGNGGNDMKKKE